MRRVLVLAAVLLLAACSKPLDTPVPTDSAQLDSLKPVLQKLPEEEQQLFVQYVLRRTFASGLAKLNGGKFEPIPEGMTIGKAIAEQWAFKASQVAREQQETAKREAAAAAEKQAQADRKAAVEKMLAVVGIEVLKADLVPEEIHGVKVRDHLRVSVQLVNKTDKAIVGVKWVAVFKDKFGDRISAGRLKTEGLRGRVWVLCRHFRASAACKSAPSAAGTPRLADRRLVAG